MSIGSDDPTTGRARQGPRPEVADRGTNEGGAASSTSDLIDVDARLDAAVDGVRRRACGLAVALTVDGTTSVVLDEGRDLLTDHTLFEIGSVTKTMTALVLATAVADGEVTLGTTVGEVLGTAAHRVAPVTLLQLATHTAGLPRLAPNHGITGDDPEDPYARFDEERLLAALAEVTPAGAPTEYSNFGFQILGYALERLLATPLTQLFQARIFDPLGMTDSRCGDFLEGDQRVLGYGREGVVPFWGLRLAGPGGVASSIADLARYVTAMYAPPFEAFGRAVELATSIYAAGASAPKGLGWMLEDGLWCHGGSTAGFGCFVAFHGPSRAGVALAMNSGGPIVRSLHGQGLRLLADVVRDQSSPAVDFDAAYSGAPGWDIGRPQPAMLELAQSGALRGRVLDVGCGTGEHALLAAGLGLDATGVDSAPGAIRLATRKASDRSLPAQFVVGNALDLDGLGIFDTVVDTGLFHVFDDEQRMRYVDSLASAVRPGGSCYLLCFSEQEPGGWPPRRVSEVEIRQFRRGLEGRLGAARHLRTVQPQQGPRMAGQDRTSVTAERGFQAWGGNSVPAVRLGPAHLAADDVSTATARPDRASGSWQVEFTLTSDGAARFNALFHAVGTGGQIAILLDGRLVSAPRVASCRHPRKALSPGSTNRQRAT